MPNAFSTCWGTQYVTRQSRTAPSSTALDSRDPFHTCVSQAEAANRCVMRWRQVTISKSGESYVCYCDWKHYSRKQHLSTFHGMPITVIHSNVNSKMHPTNPYQNDDNGGGFQPFGPTITSGQPKQIHLNQGYMNNAAQFGGYQDQREPGGGQREAASELTDSMVGSGYGSVIDLTRENPEKMMAQNVHNQVMLGPQGMRNARIGTSSQASAFGTPPVSADQTRFHQNQGHSPRLVQSYDSRDLHTAPTEPTSGGSAHKRKIQPNIDRPGYPQQGQFQNFAVNPSGIPRPPSSIAGKEDEKAGNAASRQGSRKSKDESRSNGKTTKTWRLPPSQSKSDLKIKIKRKESGLTDEYDVHRDVIIKGARKSEVLEQTIKQNKLSNKNGVLTLELSNATANAFPALLDFAYGHNTVDSVSKKSEAFAMYDLAQHLMIPLLMEEIAGWFKKKVKISKVLDFLDQAQNFNVSGPLVNVGVEVCASNFDDIGKDVAGQLHANVLLMVLERVWEMNYIFHLRTDYVTDLVLERTQESTIDKETFYKLTDKRFLPVLEPRSALKLLIVEEEFNDDDSTFLTCLQRRCVRSLVHNWGFLCDEFESPESMAEILSCLKPHVLASVLVSNSKFGTSKSKKNKGT